MNEKEYQKYCVGRWKYNTRDNINGFSNSYRMRWLLFPHYKTRLNNEKKIQTNEIQLRKFLSSLAVCVVVVFIFLIIITGIIFHIILLIIDNVEIITTTNSLDGYTCAQIHAYVAKFRKVAPKDMRNFSKFLFLLLLLRVFKHNDFSLHMCVWFNARPFHSSPKNSNSWHLR